jgi:hypothetical protein
LEGGQIAIAPNQQFAVSVGGEGAIIIWKIPSEMNAKDAREGMTIGESKIAKKN